MRIVGNKKGQFIIIAALLLAIMIVSASVVMFSAVTYFKHERWEEYIIVIDGVKASTANVLTLSLANYTQTLNGSVLKTNLDSWRDAVKRAYSGYGAILGYSLASGSYSAYGMNPINYNLGLASTWNQRISFSAANVTTSLNITSVGLSGYRFTSTVFLRMNITDVLWYDGKGSNPGPYVGVRVVMYSEGPAMITNLKKSNFVLFQVGGVNKTFSLVRYYESVGHSGNPALNAYVYELRYDALSDPGSVTAKISVVDSRGVKVTGQATWSTVAY
jgi:hypothetical protein